MTRINLNRSEIQSRYDRVLYAERLIEQLPESHEGRNTWLMNYGVRDQAIKLRFDNNVGWDNFTQSAETINGDVVDGKAAREIAKDELFYVNRSEHEKIILNDPIATKRQPNFTINIGDRFRCIQNSTTNSPRPIEKGAIGTVTYLNGVSTFMSFGEIADYVSNETLHKDFEKLPALVTTYSSAQQAMQSTQFCCPQCGGDHFGSRNEGSIFVCHGHETYNINDHSFKPPCGWSGLRSECFKNMPVDNYSTTPTVAPVEHPLAELTNVIKYWNSPWTPGVWWYEFDDYPKYFSRFDSAIDYGKGRWRKIDKPPFTPRHDPLDEQVKKVMADLCNVDDLTRDVEAIIKKHFADWEPKE